MSNQIVSQLRNEVVRLETECARLEERKKELQAQVRAHKKALKLLEGNDDEPSNRHAGKD